MRVSLVATICAAIWWLWTAVLFPSHEHRFRIVLSVATPEGPREGSSVWSITCFEPRRGAVLPTSGCKSLRGEAIFVDLGNGKNIVGLMKQGVYAEVFDNSIAGRVYYGKNFKEGSSSWYKEAPSWQGIRSIHTENLTAMATVRDLNNSDSVRLLEPSASAFSSEFGPGYRFLGATLEMVPVGIWPLNLFGLTGVAVTTGIEQKVLFLVSQRAKIASVISDMPPRYQVSLSQFIR